MPAECPHFDRLLTDAVESTALPHALGIVIHNGEVAYRGHAGDTDPSRIYRIASMTKLITSVGAMILVERGQLGLEDPYTDYVEVPEPRVLAGLDAGGKPSFRTAERAATVRELLTHTCGFAMGVWNQPLFEYYRAQGEPGLGPVGIARLEAPMVCDPGSQWHYSIGTDILGLVIEKVSGVDLEAFCQREIFEPLAMTDTTFTLDESEASRLVTPYRRRSSGELIPIELPHPRANGFCSGAGGLVSTPNDYAGFLCALAKGGMGEQGRILSAETVATMQSNHTGAIPIPPMRTNDPVVSADVDFFPGIDTCWGLGFLINNEDVPGRRRAGSGTWAGLYNTHFWIDPSAGIAGLLMTQTLPFCGPELVALYDSYERAVYAEFG